MTAPPVRGPVRPLTERQKRALLLADAIGVTRTVERSMPSLAGRGLAEKYRQADSGRSYVYWRLTEAGRAEAARIRQERQAKPKIMEHGP